MTGVSEAADAAQAQAVETIRQAAPWIERCARGGYGARGVVYLTIGALAAAAAFGLGGGATDMRGAIHALGGVLAGPLGRALLGALAAGLAGYAAWRLVMATVDPECRPDRRGRWYRVFVRLGYLGSAAIHVKLAYEAARLALGAGATQGHFTRGAIAWVLTVPLGRWLVMATGAGIVVAGGWQCWRAAASDVCRRLDVGRLGPPASTTIGAIGRAGIASRGVVFVVLGMLLMHAGWRYDPDRADSLADAIREIGAWRLDAPLGGLFGAVALGLAAFGVWELLQARYRRIDPAPRGR
jgi:Domain of Unknown Function (DUF1206)